jgi:hypothetical protein
MTERKYMPTIGQLCDRLSIVNLKSMKINKEYEKEAAEIMEDLNNWAIENNINIKDFGQFIRALQMNAVVNDMIWNNESRARQGSDEQNHLLKLTHSLNRVRNQAVNVISHIIGERKDLKLDVLDAELTKEYGYDFDGILENDN